MIVLKLGGSLLTSKEESFSLRREVLRRVAWEIREGIANGKNLIIVQGGGSFGHPLASEYSLHEGLKNTRQIEGLVLTRLAMQTFNQALVASLVEAGLPAIGFETASLFTTSEGKIENYRKEAVEGFLGLGTVPVLYGDVVYDRARGFSILSGDRIIARLAKDFSPDRVILATDVDGIFTADPRLGGKAELVEEVNPGNFPEVLSSIGTGEGDVTGGMAGKLEELFSLAKGGHSSLIVNALVEGRLKKALLGQKVRGTRVRGGE